MLTTTNSAHVPTAEATITPHATGLKAGGMPVSRPGPALSKAWASEAAAMTVRRNAIPKRDHERAVNRIGFEPMRHRGQGDRSPRHSDRAAGRGQPGRGGSV